jgi:PKD repeat protein
MKTRLVLSLSSLAVLALVMQLVFAHSGTPQAAKSGAPGENNCTQCHSGTLNSGGGSVSILFNNGQNSYTPGQVYPISVTVADPIRTRMGFQVTALQGATGPTVGTFTLTNTNNTSSQSATVSGNARTYVSHKNANTTTSTWTFNWTAPASAISSVTFYVCGNATDNNGQTSSDRAYTTTLTATLAVPTASFVANDTTTCPGVSVTYSDQSTGATSRSWSFPGGTPNSSTLATPTVTYAAPGAYNATLIVTNVAGSDTLLRTTYVEVGQLPSLSGQASATSCAGDTDGAINLIVGTTTGNTFVWSNGATSEDLSGLSAGTYTVTVSSSQGCTSTQTFTVTSPSALAVTTTSTNSDCSANTGTATATPAGGTTGYSYLWSNGNTGQTATALPAGSHSVTVTDANGCTATATVAVTNNNAPDLLSTLTPTTCAGDFDGIATINALNGVAPYSFLWSDGQTTPTASNLAAGTYSVTVTDASGCIAVTAVTILSPAPITNTMATSPDLGTGNGTATASPSGGNGGFSYLWSNGQTNANATGLAAGNYTVTITDAQGCSLIDTVNVTLVITHAADLRPNLFQVGPVPFSELLVLRPKVDLDGQFMVSLIDHQGRLVYAEQIRAAAGMPVVLRPGTLSDGVYFLVVETSEGRLVQKVLRRSN